MLAARRSVLPSLAAILGFGLLAGCQWAWAGAQKYEPLSVEVRSALRAEIEDNRPPRVNLPSRDERMAYLKWLGDASDHLQRREPNYRNRIDLLETIYYEARRAGIEPELVLGLIQVESNFRKYAVSNSGARGLTQVMPFWSDLIGDGDAHKLFVARINVRFGCVILRHYLDIEDGKLFRALGRYNGSLGQADYPNMVLAAWQQWRANVGLPPVSADRTANPDTH